MMENTTGADFTFMVTFSYFHLMDIFTYVSLDFNNEFLVFNTLIKSLNKIMKMKI